MALTKKQLIVFGSVATIVVISLIVGVTVGVVVGRRQPKILSTEEIASRILANNPLIDG
jgi:hypothetical protein